MELINAVVYFRYLRDLMKFALVQLAPIYSCLSCSLACLPVFSCVTLRGSTYFTITGTGVTGMAMHMNIYIKGGYLELDLAKYMILSTLCMYY